MQPTPDDIQTYITQGLPCEYIQVEGDGQHFYATIVSAAFFDKTRVERHQIVYGVLGVRMKSEIHALSMKVLTPEEWRMVSHIE